MKEFKVKIFYYDAHEKMIDTDIVHVHCMHIDEARGLAQQFAEYLAATHHPECVRLEACLLADKKKTPVFAH